MSRRAQTLLVTSFVLAGLVDFARADVVAARGRQPLISTQVLRLEEGRIICKDDGGAEVGFAIDQVDYMQITGWQMLNLGEKQRRADDMRRAAVSYERALADLQLEPAATAGALDRALLVKCRLIPAWDAQSKFDRAVELYLDVIEKMPQLAEGLKPTHYPETGAAVLEMAGRQVDAAISRHGQDDIARVLQAWKSTWPVRQTTSAPAEVGAAPKAQGDPRVLAAIQEVSKLVEAGKGEQALAQIKELQQSVRGNLQADLFYWQARAFESLHATAPVELGKNGGAKPRRSESSPGAVVAYMRVVVHFPGHSRAAECLYRAAGICRRAGQREQASALLSELIDVYPKAKGPDGSVWADKAREELK